jgi:hypothetical protein
VNIEEVLEALSDIETPPGSDDELDDTGEESSSTDEGSEGELESIEESEASQRAIRHRLPGLLQGGKEREKYAKLP